MLKYIIGFILLLLIGGFVYVAVSDIPVRKTERIEEISIEPTVRNQAQTAPQTTNAEDSKDETMLEE